MPVKLTYDVVYNYFKEQGCELLETEYINNATKMRYQCSCGNKSEIIFNNFKSHNRRCAKCGGSEKLKFEDVYNSFKDKGCELLETEYINAHTKMRYRCSCDNISVIEYSNFKHLEQRCRKCSGKEKLTYETVYKIFKNEGCELLETKYINNHTKMKYRCECGEESLITYNNFQNDQRCRECGYKKNTGKNHFRFQQDRTRLARAGYLRFDLKKLYILSDDPKYTDYTQSQKTAKATGNRWNKSDYTVDHIYPRIAFIDNDLDNIYGQTIVKEICNLRENLRIIPQKENGSKGGKYIQEEFMAWFNEKLTVYHTI
jgi:hypothetical protein